MNWLTLTPSEARPPVPEERTQAPSPGTYGDILTNGNHGGSTGDFDRRKPIQFVRR
jgi:hypothetical protein